MLDNFSSQLGQSLTLLAFLYAMFILYKLFGADKNRNRHPYPPGPKGNFLLGNLLDIPSFKPWLSYTNMGKQYNSDILHLTFFGQHIVVLNSVYCADALMGKRASRYSGRPGFPMLELMDWDWMMTLSPYSDWWRRARRCFQQNFRTAASQQYEPLQVSKVRELLKGLLTSLDEPGAHFKTIGAALSMAVIYDIDIKPPNDYYFNLAEEAMRQASAVVLSNSTQVVNAFPALLRLPRWVPGIGFQKAAAAGKLIAEMKEGTFEYALNQMKKGNNASLIARLLEEHDATGGPPDDVEIIKKVAAMAYAGGSDTTGSAINSFFYSMALHPDAQKKAQEEIDRVVGNQRLPDFHDRKSLPYTEAVYREVMRIRPVLPMGVPHTSIEDDVYNGYFIPEGSVVFSNIWAMTRDEEKYPRPNQFIPERFLNERGELNDDSTVLAFGFGRRICVGRHIASSMIWLTIASVLATLDIHKSKDDTGSEEEVEAAYSHGTSSHPNFKCTLSPRSNEAIKLIQESN
ncbi:hypothetical protein AX14_003985 [Amanita brunnescens Koide BX004]|nr:hypothetical protein AX14_003985 [Amanita brunnescens Koide BX004]